jgi:hypothetical protein
MLGWRRLACAVIEDAFRCAGIIGEKPVLDFGAQLRSGRRARWYRQRHVEAIEYLMGRHPDVAFPIEVACALAGIDFEALRERVSRGWNLPLAGERKRPHIPLE